MPTSPRTAKRQTVRTPNTIQSQSFPLRDYVGIVPYEKYDRLPKYCLLSVETQYKNKKQAA